MISRAQYFGRLGVMRRRWNIVIYCLLIIVSVFLTTKSIIETVGVKNHMPAIPVSEQVFVYGMSLFNAFVVVLFLFFTGTFMAYLTKNTTQYWLKDKSLRSSNYMSTWLVSTLEYALIAISVVYVLLMLVRIGVINQRIFEINTAILSGLYFFYMGTIGGSLLGVTKKVYWIGYLCSLMFYALMMCIITS